MENILASILVLDFRKPEETRLCLESIQKFCNFHKKVIYLDNGSNQEYPWQFYKEGLCDVLICDHSSEGTGNGQERLFRNCITDWAFLMQNDQRLIYPINEEMVKGFINLINTEKLGYIDLAGAQAGNKPHQFSDRFGFINVDLYLSIYKGEKGKLGGPGKYNFNTYTEEYITRHFEKNNIKVAHFQSLVEDLGKTSIREIGDGLYSHRTDTKVLTVLKKPTYKTEVFPPFSQQEWSQVLAGEGDWFTIGQVPEIWKNNIFRVWPD